MRRRSSSYLLVNGLELAVVAHIVLLLLVFLGHFVVLGNLALLGSHLLVGSLYITVKVLNASLQTGNLIFQVLYCLGQLSADNLNLVYLRINPLQCIQSHKALFYSHINIKRTYHLLYLFLYSFFFRCHFFCHFIFIF